MVTSQFFFKYYIWFDYDFEMTLDIVYKREEKVGCTCFGEIFTRAAWREIWRKTAICEEI